MKHKSAKENLLIFLQSNEGWHHNGDLQRKDIRNKNGSLAMPRTLVRRLQELVDEGLAFVSYNTKHEALFSAEFKPKMKQIISFKETPTGRVAVIDLVPS